MGWQKRGRSMNSQTGFGSFVGGRTQKLLHYALKNKSCKMCEANAKRFKKALEASKKNLTPTAIRSPYGLV